MRLVCVPAQEHHAHLLWLPDHLICPKFLTQGGQVKVILRFLEFLLVLALSMLLFHLLVLYLVVHRHCFLFLHLARGILSKNQSNCLANVDIVLPSGKQADLQLLAEGQLLNEHLNLNKELLLITENCLVLAQIVAPVEIPLALPAAGYSRPSTRHLPVIHHQGLRQEVAIPQGPG